MNSPHDDPSDQLIVSQEAATLLAMGMINAILRALKKANIMTAAHIEAELNEVVDALNATPVIKDSPEVQRRLPMLRRMLLDDIEAG